MGTEKVAFTFKVKEENKGTMYFFLIFIVVLLLVSIVGIFHESRSQKAHVALYIAQEWSNALLTSNESLQYELLSADARKFYMDDRVKLNEGVKASEFENQEVIRWIDDSNHYIFQLHNYGLKDCSNCYRDVWVQMMNGPLGWKVTEYNFSKERTKKYLKDSNGENVFSSKEIEEEEKPFLEKLFDNFL
ncbi:hypothetical protein [Fictibacillus barbaricus]|uniref:DUF4829 domain-containing protein n=1 Tax=Fictibacillus barbaricus TaxID=182136 RepID=A0ABU1TX66_9BACL|nr:hypothetical protein [Fictibacillus barbaricus]MDR7071773.1 hypothetical protein [Fictibacillus barbaricus]